MPLSSLRDSVCSAFVRLVLIAVATTAPLQGQQATWPIDGPAFSASVDELQKAAAKVAPEQFMQATVLFEREAYRLDAAGRVTYSYSMVYRIETQAGIKGWSEIWARWEPWYENKPEVRARVIQPDGKVSQLDQTTVSDSPASGKDDDTYTDARIQKAPLPGLAVGAIVEEEIVIADKSPYFSGGGIYRDYFSRNAPVVRSELIIEAPKSVKLQYRVHLMPDIQVTDADEGASRRLKFVQGYLPARQGSDIQLSTHNYLSPMVEFSTGESWASVARAYLQLAEPQIDPLQAKSLLPSEPSTGRMDLIQRIVSRLHKDIRYTGVEFGQASLQPQTATEVIKRHFGDCKDKAALLVAMLRAAGIPANLALLDAGPGLDVAPELPGMNQFDHAIVYVPADGKGGDALWIDATAEFTQVGTLPSMDRGRQALVIAEGTSGLTLTPISKPEDNALTELRDVVMAEYGLAHITETSLTHGQVDAEYRSEYGVAETREKKTNLETYAKDYYLAKALKSVEHGDGKDLSKPFVLKLDMPEARRGNTMIDDAAVAIPFSSLFYRLPAWFRTDPQTSGRKLTPQQEDNQKRAVQARTNEYDVEPLITEWRYKITPPAGFALRALPEDKSTDMGPAKFTQHYETDSQGVITAVLRFSTVKPRYTVDEVLALRDAVIATYKQDMIVILFDQVGSKLLAAGNIREGLAADHALIERHPTEAIHHAQFAYALLKAGMGDRARNEAQQATSLESKSAVAYKALGWICEFNAIGVQYSEGFDRECSEASFKKAIELDPEGLDSRVNLALIEEYDRAGERYAMGAHLKDAILQYKAIKEKDKSTGDQYEDNLLFDLMYDHEYKELLEELDKLPSSVTRDAMGITAMVAQSGGAKGIAAGIERADHLPAGAQERSSALASSGRQLVRLRLYPEAAAMLSASVEGQSNSASVAQQISIFRHLTAWNHDFLPASDPRGVVQRIMINFLTGSFTQEETDKLLSRHAFSSDEEWNRNYKKAEQASGMLHLLAAKSELTADVLLDVIVGNMRITSEGDDQVGYKVSVQSLGAKPQQFFVSKDEGKLKVVTDGSPPSEAGNEVLFLLKAGREAESRALLDWARGLLHKGGGDDPLSGPLLPRFWTIGDTKDARTMRLAAASLVATNPAIRELLPSLRAAWEKATTEQERLDLGLLLATGYQTVQDGPNLKAVSAEILKKYPDSYTAIDFAGEADALLKNWSEWNTMLSTRIAKHPDDEDLLRMKVKLAEEQGDFVLARATEQRVIDEGKATDGDYNLYAWTALFDGKVDADVARAAQQATMLTKDSNFHTLHTLACIYAFQGKTAESRDLLLKAMMAENLSQPNSEVWYGFGSIYEQYGVNDAAIDAYKKVEKPEGRISPVSTYLLAQARLKALSAVAK